MLEKVWKPYFDAWSENTSKVLEHLLQTRAYLSSVSRLMESAFRLKTWRDKALHLLLLTAGLPTDHDQKQILHQLFRLSAQVEDLAEQLEALRNEKRGNP